MRVKFLRLALFICLAGFHSVGASGASNEDLFVFKGKQWKNADLGPRAQQLFYEVELERFEKVKRLVDSAIFDMHVEEVAAAQKKDIAEAEKSILKLKDPSDSDAKSWFNKNKDRIPYPFEQIKGEIKRMIVAEKTQARRQEVVEQLKKQGKFSFKAIPPVAPVMEINTLGYPAVGNPKSKVTVVEFADYQCPHCRHAAEAMKKVLPRFKDKIRFVYMDFPINPSGISTMVAEGALCANEQGKFWQYHDLAFSKQSSLTKESPKQLAKEVGLDGTKFDSCMKSGRSRDTVQKSKREAERLGISGTPAIYVNGRRQMVAHTEKDLIAMLEKALK